MSEKPLHARVVEALGWRWYGHRDTTESLHPGARYLATKEHANVIYGHELFAEYASGDEPIADCAYDNAPRYDTDWSAAGPEIQRLRISLTSEADGWFARRSDMFVATAYHPTQPLIAVCNLILLLAEAGRLGRLDGYDERFSADDRVGGV